MAYNRIENPKLASMENIELNARNAATSYDYAPRSEFPLEIKDADRKQKSRRKGARRHSLSAQPRRAGLFTSWRIFILVFDILLASTPIMFISLALIAAKLDKQNVSGYGSKLSQVLLVSPTIFPLIFAALMGRFFRHLGVYLAERGTTIGRLEQLIGCQSVFLALERQFCLRPWSIVGVLSILVWLLSPLGGQSALRLLDQEGVVASSIATIRYMDPLTITNTFIEGSDDIHTGRPVFTSIFLSALVSSSKTMRDPVDLWGNVKLPIYRDIENSTSDEWKIADQTPAHNTTYASLIGIPVTTSVLGDTSSFNIKARQFDVQCSSNVEMGRNASNFGNLTATWKLFTLTPADNCTYTMGNAYCRPWCRSYPCPILSESIANQSSEPEMSISVANCSVSFDYYEAAVNCSSAYCAVQKMRKLDLISDGYDLDNDTGTRTAYLGGILSLLPTTDDATGDNILTRGPTTMEKWMYDPTNFLGVTRDNMLLYEVSPANFSERLTILFNTFWQSTYGTTAIGGVLPDEVLRTGLLEGSISNVSFNETQAVNVNDMGRRYRTNWKWFTALLVSSLILQIAAYIGLVLKYITLAPDIIGYASSLTLLNPYVPVPVGGTTLHGLQRSALLHELPVRIGDVCANENLGSIALAETSNDRVARLQRDRFYI